MRNDLNGLGSLLNFLIPSPVQNDMAVLVVRNICAYVAVLRKLQFSFFYIVGLVKKELE